MNLYDDYHEQYSLYPEKESNLDLYGNSITEVRKRFQIPDVPQKEVKKTCNLNNLEDKKRHKFIEMIKNRTKN